MQNGTSQMAENELRNLTNQSNSIMSPLPIHQAFSTIAHRDERSGNVLLHFKLNCKKDAAMPTSVQLEIKTPQRDVFTGTARLYGLKAAEYEGKNMLRTETITLALKNYPEIWDSPGVEITFSDNERKSAFMIYI